MRTRSRNGLIQGVVSTTRGNGDRDRLLSPVCAKRAQTVKHLLISGDSRSHRNAATTESLTRKTLPMAKKQSCLTSRMSLVRNLDRPSQLISKSTAVRCGATPFVEAGRQCWRSTRLPSAQKRNQECHRWLLGSRFALSKNNYQLNLDGSLHSL